MAQDGLTARGQSLAAQRGACVVWNPSAGPATPTDELKPRVREVLGGGVEIVETTSAAHARDVVHRAANAGSLIVAAGGDGTVHTAVNALMESGQPAPLAVLPFGTSNNFCRSLGVPLDAAAAVDALSHASPQEVDLVRVSHGGASEYMVNLASGGNSDRVIKCLKDEDKKNWGPWVYLRNALPVLTDLAAYEVEIEADDRPVLRRNLWNVVVANGAYAASGLRVVPQARVDDGLLDVVTIEDGDPVDLASLAAGYLLGDYQDDPRVNSFTARRVVIRATPSMEFYADGESLSGDPLTFEAVPQAIRLLISGASLRQPQACWETSDASPR